MKRSIILTTLVLATVMVSSCGNQTPKVSETTQSPKPVGEEKAKETSKQEDTVATKTSEEKPSETLKEETTGTSSIASVSGDKIADKNQYETIDSEPEDASGAIDLSQEDSMAIIAKFQEQYTNKDPEIQSKMALNIESFEEGKFFKGSVSIGTRTVQNLFAIKKTDWKIVSFGDATENCKWIVSYKFPADMAPDCYTDTGSIATSSGTSVLSGELAPVQ